MNHTRVLTTLMTALFTYYVGGLYIDAESEKSDILLSGSRVVCCCYWSYLDPWNISYDLSRLLDFCNTKSMVTSHHINSHWHWVSIQTQTYTTLLLLQHLQEQIATPTAQNTNISTVSATTNMKVGGDNFQGDVRAFIYPASFFAALAGWVETSRFFLPLLCL